eukprot:1161618-Pelagomonas_calceolata.AAC.10
MLRACGKTSPLIQCPPCLSLVEVSAVQKSSDPVYVRLSSSQADALRKPPWSYPILYIPILYTPHTSVPAA